MTCQSPVVVHKKIQEQQMQSNLSDNSYLVIYTITNPLSFAKQGDQAPRKKVTLQT